MTTATSVYPPLESRPLKDTIVLFDVDETLSKARQVRCDRPLPQLITTNIGFRFAVSHPGDA